MGTFSDLAQRVLEGHRPTRDEALCILESTDDELLRLLDAAFLIRREHKGRTVNVHVLKNAKSGACTEDCGFCSQSIRHGSEVPRYRMESADQLVEGASEAEKTGAVVYCIVASSRAPSEKELDTVCSAVARIRAKSKDLGICVSLGLLSEGQAERLKEAGATRYNHNLETSRRFFPKIITTHPYDDRVNTIRTAKRAGLEACAGGIMGLGETLEDRVDLALTLRDLEVEAIPVNFLDPREGTPLENRPKLAPGDCLRTLAMFRFVHPTRDIRAAGGREACLKSMQPLALYAANSLFTDGYLTTGGQGHGKDWAMIEEAGFKPAVAGA